MEGLDKAKSTITDYLTFAKPSVENVKILDLPKELTSIKNFIEPYAAINNVKIEMSLEETIYSAGEKEKLHQCLINIVKNGIEAMPQDGKLKVELKRFKSNAVITIADTGIGMNEEQLERLGSAFLHNKRYRNWTWHDGCLQCCESYGWPDIC
ncbi:HAMP domain-containing histidine kinase [Domibacillus sp. A3M-37]|uniref:sensor histidine kinase n=1 Tax=Domibacillus sp. A3M-37 TaxID=2962037 RepID=UPI0020B84B1E|nr:HAMP domain-containing sensor histidine kinase [Domibacillus sp. A3M-37]MCP3764222.1 HAMP domain-containing histidine kinase [Domibacillus sp. A3M-37]